MQSSNPNPSVERMEDLVETHTNTILTCYQKLAEKNSNLVLEATQETHLILEWDHYPKGDVIDKEQHSQYYYHSHSSKDQDRVPEHGHFHVFSRLPMIEPGLTPVARSQKNLENPKKDNLSHLFAIAMTDKGYPSAFFTTNHWIVGGVWFDARETIDFLDRFSLGETKKLPVISCWLNALVQLFKEPLKELILLRDEVIHNWQNEHPDTLVYTDRRLEVTSVLPLTT